MLINRLFADLDVRTNAIGPRGAGTANPTRAPRAQDNSAQLVADGAIASQFQQRFLAQAEADLSGGKVWKSPIIASGSRPPAWPVQSQPCEQAMLVPPDQSPRLKELEEEHRELQRSLDGARAQISQLAGAALELAEARSQLARLREELLEARSQTQAAGNAGESDLQRQVCDLELERRSRCGSELETVRRHAAELADHLAESRRQFVEERSEWNAELRHLRRLLERQSQLLEDRNAFGMYGSGAARKAARRSIPSTQLTTRCWER